MPRAEEETILRADLGVVIQCRLPGRTLSGQSLEPRIAFIGRRGQPAGIFVFACGQSNQTRFEPLIRGGVHHTIGATNWVALEAAVALTSLTAAR